ncbi:hypothetical protein SUDANB120_00325 [Streptomyces sp. enrichment culture]|uniref:hypothetical protein n=1 Tax=Streptomyces sp. enrichment culture TaxID=1795815 RepID=UPI003F57F52A
MSTTSSLAPVITATAQWLTRAYPASGGALQLALAEAQALQAATVAAWLRYPTRMDAELAALTGARGSGSLDWAAGADDGLPLPGPYDGAHDADPVAPAPVEDAEAWRSWVDEAVASWAACLLARPDLASAAVDALAGTEHAGAVPVGFRRLTSPTEGDVAAAALLRHPDLLEPVARLYREGLLERLGRRPAEA